jgi:hypothetical protein
MNMTIANFSPPPSAALLLWAHGRSATETLFGTLEKDAHVHPCYGVKEAFKGKRESRTLSYASLMHCARTACREDTKCAVGTHLKPSHLRGNSSELQTTPEFVAAADQAGWRLMVVVYRRNSLARFVSSWELSHYRHTTNLKRRHSTSVTSVTAPDEWALASNALSMPYLWSTQHAFTGMIRTFEEQDRSLLVGIEAALATPGWRVLALDFLDVTQKLCRSSGAVRQELRELGHTWLHPYVPGEEENCRTHVGHTKTSHSEEPLAKRLGSERAANMIRAQLNGTVYEWMLDLKREVPPPEYVEQMPYMRLVTRATRAGQISGGGEYCGWCKKHVVQ